MYLSKAVVLMLIVIITFVFANKLICDFRKYDGEFIINETNPDKDLITLAINGNIARLFSKKYVILKVVNTTDRTDDIR